jgi:subtilisin family serine protease
MKNVEKYFKKAAPELLLLVLILSIYVAPIALKAESGETTVYEGTFTTLQGEEFKVKKVIKDGEKFTLFIDKAGVAYSKEDFYKKLAEETPKLDPELERRIAEAANLSEVVSVIVLFKDQPQQAVASEVKGKYEAKLKECSSQIQEVYRRVAEEYRKAAKESGLPSEGREMLKAMAEFEKQHITADEKARMDEARATMEKLLRDMRREFAPKAREEVAKAQRDTVTFVRSAGGVVKAQYATLNALSISMPIGRIQELASRPGVEAVYLDRKLGMNLDSSPYTIWADAFWGEGITGSPYDIAVVDSGIDRSHPALSGHTFYETTYADWDQDGISDKDSDDYNGHGTHVAGIASSTDLTYQGVAYGCDAIINAKAAWDDDGLPGGWAYMYWSDAMEAIEWAIFSAGDDADSINLSYGGSPGSGDTAMARFLDSVVDWLWVPVAVSAGNNGPNPYTVNDPATAYNIMSVAASDDRGTWDRIDDTLAGFSSRGPTGDGRYKPDITAPGVDITSTNAFWEGPNPDFIAKSGTSMAAPHIAAAYLLLLQYGIYSPMQMKAMLINSAEKRSVSKWDQGWGWGYTELYDAKYRTNVFSDTLYYDGDYKFYRGPMYTGTGEPYDRATVVWNRHSIYEGPHYPYWYWPISDIDLHLYDLNGNWLDSSAGVLDNVEQVVSPVSGDVVVKVDAWDLESFPWGEVEGYALATPPGFTQVQPPTLQVQLSYPSRPPVGSTFTIYGDVYNYGGIPAHNVEVYLSLGEGLTLVSGSNPQTLGSISPGGYKRATWQVRVDQAGWRWFGVQASSNCYGEWFYGYGGGYIGGYAYVLPVIHDRPSSTGWVTGVSVQNVGWATATVELYAYDQSGYQLGRIRTSIDPGRIYNAYARAVAGREFLGTMVIVSDQPISAQARVLRYGIPALGSIVEATRLVYYGGQAFFSFINDKPSTLGWQTGIFIRNNGVSTATVTLYAYDENGNFIRAVIVNIAPNALYNVYARVVAGREFIGSMVVDSNQPISGAAFIYRSDVALSYNLCYATT